MDGDSHAVIEMMTSKVCLFIYLFDYDIRIQVTKQEYETQTVVQLSIPIVADKFIWRNASFLSAVSFLFFLSFLII